MMTDIVIPHMMPAPLREGDRVAIVAPSGTIKSEYVYDAAAVLEGQGWRPYIAPHALGRCGTYSGTADERFADLRDALLEPSVRAVFCARGGYGAVHLLDRLAALPLADDPKWLVGYSDISALHALLWTRGVASIHGPMARHLSTLGGVDPDALTLFDQLCGRRPVMELGNHPFNRPGRATATLAGGNLAVVMGLVATPYDVIRPGTLLFIEDVSEPVYKVERQLYQLLMSGVLRQLAGLVVGQFTEYHADVNGDTMETMISRMLHDCPIPVAFGAPVGHVDHNVPMISGATATLDVTPSGARLTYS